MQNLAIYELVDVKMRGTIDLTTMHESFSEAFAQGYPEATNVMRLLRSLPI